MAFLKNLSLLLKSQEQQKLILHIVELSAVILNLWMCTMGFTKKYDVYNLNTILQANLNERSVLFYIKTQ